MTTSQLRVRIALLQAQLYPYHERKPRDAAELAACAVIAELAARARVVGESEPDRRYEIVQTLAEVIRQSYAEEPLRFGGLRLVENAEIPT